ncbi:HlyD family efflux transporter periplasmic adaptor subunit [Pseudomonas sp. NPDC007930]|uniref:HlyD family efflux transporter periplasmic adaptor subunit n=1 Tax=Pseudomonas sp. NPDC007930 TaxID=3364417 RepID=UPI0036E1E1A9
MINVQLPTQPPSAHVSAGDAEKAHRAALQLLAIEAEVRRQPSERELFFHWANHLQDLVPHGQAMIWRRGGVGKGLQLNTVNSLPAPDRHAPLAQAMGAWLGACEQRGELAKPGALLLPSGGDPTLAEFPLRHGFWQPLLDREKRLQGGALFLREGEFAPRDGVLLQRLGETYGHAWRAFGKPRSLLSRLPLGRRNLAIAAAVLVAIGCVPVRLSVMAPVEVIADQPYILTAPINGVIKKLLIGPNTQVSANQPLVQFEDIQPRNEMVLAQQELAVAEARDRRTSAAAFNDQDAAHEMAIAAAEHDLAKVKYNYAVEVLQRTLVRTPINGLAVYSDRRDWEGRSVMVGEEILQVADPAKVNYRIDLSTANAIDLASGNPVAVYLESAPLGGLNGQLRSVSYTPKSTPAGVTSYTLIASPGEGATPRIGARGTARVYGNYAPLAFQLLRRPIAAVRQYLGV